jgi:hypothetical protein
MSLEAAMRYESGMTNKRPCIAPRRWVLFENLDRAGSRRLPRIVVVSLRILLVVLATFSVIGCGAFLEVGGELADDIAMGDAGAGVEEMSLFARPAATVIANEVMPVEMASEWPWIGRRAIIVNPFGGRITASTGEFLGEFRIARGGSFVDVVRAGETTALRFSVQGSLESSAPSELMDRYGRRVAIVSKLDDGRLFMRLPTNGQEPLSEGLFPLPVRGENSNQRKPLNSGPQEAWWRTTGCSGIVTLVDENGHKMYVDRSSEGSFNCAREQPSVKSAPPSSPITRYVDADGVVHYTTEE